MVNNDKLVIGGHEFSSRFILGSGKYSMKLIEAAVKDAGAEIITLAVRRANTKEQESILDYIPEGITLLPNTSGARNAEEAVRIARLARELGCGDFVKIEIMRDSKYLLPDNQETINGNTGKGRICGHALYVSRPDCGKGYGKRRGGDHHAAGFPHRLQQRIGNKGLYSDPHR